MVSPVAILKVSGIKIMVKKIRVHSRPSAVQKLSHEDAQEAQKKSFCIKSFCQKDSCI
jgi:hypothetical protein